MHKKIIMIVCGSLIMASSLLGCGKEESPGEMISLGNYKEVTLEGVHMSVGTGEEVDQYIEEIRMRNAQEVDIAGEPAKEGDLAYIDFTAKVDGEDFEEISEEDYMLTIGMGEIAEGLDQSVIGHSAGDVYEYTGKISNDFYNVASYYNEDMAGKEAVFEITVKSVSRLQLPELNDEFVKTVSEKSETVEEYREEVKALLEEDGLKEIDVKDAIWQAVLKGTEVKEYPKEELETYVHQQEEHYKKMAEEYGITYEELIEKEMGSSQKDFDQWVQKEAKEKLKEQLTAKAIAEKEKIKEEGTDKELLEKVKNWLVENSKINS